MTNIFPIDFDEKNDIAQNDYILFSDSQDGNKLKKAQYSNLKGEQGNPGTPGADGAAATISVGSTTTGEPGTNASVTNSGTSSAAVFNFTIPKGAKGDDGDDGEAATITVGTTTTLPAGSSATVTNSGTSQDAILNFGIPKGDSGPGSGDVNGPASSTDDNIATFDGATGKLIQDSGISVSALNTQTFTLSSTSDLTTAQKAYDWYVSGKNPIIVYNNKAHIIKYVDAEKLQFGPIAFHTNLNSNSTSSVTYDIIIINFSAGVVTSISTSSSGLTGNFLRTDYDYSSPYTPLYNGSPATKKYVDDSITGISFPVTSVNGQTGAVTGLQTQHSSITVTLAAANWSSQSITVSATGVTASNTVIVSPAPSDISDYSSSGVYCSAQGSGTLTFECDTEPTNDIDVNVVILN